MRAFLLLLLPLTLFGCGTPPADSGHPQATAITCSQANPCGDGSICVADGPNQPGVCAHAADSASACGADEDFVNGGSGPVAGACVPRVTTGDVQAEAIPVFCMCCIEGSTQVYCTRIRCGSICG